MESEGSGIVHSDVHMSVVRVIDSHTGGEPTRLVIEGGPDLGSGPLSERLARFRDHFDSFRSAIVNEPRGSDVVVGALLCEPHRSDCRFGVIFFNNVGYLGMCGHGTIGLVATLAHLGQLQPGLVRIDTPVGSGGRRCCTRTARSRSPTSPASASTSRSPSQVPGLGESRRRRLGRQLVLPGRATTSCA